MGPASAPNKAWPGYSWREISGGLLIIIGMMSGSGAVFEAKGSVPNSKKSRRKGCFAKKHLPVVKLYSRVDSTQLPELL